MSTTLLGTEMSSLCRLPDRPAGGRPGIKATWCQLLGFVCLALASVPAAASEPAGAVTVVDTLDEFRRLAATPGIHLRLKPGHYILTESAQADFIDLSGAGARFDCSDVTLDVETALLARFKTGTNIVKVSGRGITLHGLTIRTVGNQAPGQGCRAISVTGDDVVVRDVELRLQGSHPYGYGSFFGINGDGPIPPLKLNGIRVGGLNNTLINCRVYMRAMGHGIFIRGAQNALIKDCYVEGALRRTDDILAEREGVAFARNFIDRYNQPIPPGQMTSLSEDGIRVYPDDPEIKRRTQNVRVENCRVTRMRRGICLAFAAGENTVIGCEVTESEGVGFHIAGNTRIEDSRGDALYAHVLDISSVESKNSSVDLRVLDSRAHYGNTLLAKINGSGHRVRLTEAEPGAVPAVMTIETATDKGFGEGRTSHPTASRLTLANITAATVVLHEATSDSTVESRAGVRNSGQRNQIVRLQ